MAISRSGGSNPKRVIFTDNKGVIHEVSKVMYRNQNMTKPVKVWPDMTEFYYLKVTPSEQGWGTVVPTYATKRKIECDNSQLSLTAIPYEDYDFNYWSVTYQRPNGTTGYDSWTDNPHTITNDITLKDYDYSAVAYFKKKPAKCYFDLIDANGSSRFTWGRGGDGGSVTYIRVDSLYQDLFPGCIAYRYEYNLGAHITINTTAREGSQFTKAIGYNTWTSGTSAYSNYATFDFPSTSDKKEEIQRYVVYYNEKQTKAYVTIKSADVTKGTTVPNVERYEIEPDESVQSMSANPKSGYRFVKWSDGNINRYRQVVYNQPIDYEFIAYFDDNNFVVYGDYPVIFDGETTSVGEYKVYAGNHIISAVDVPGYVFDHWVYKTSLTGTESVNTSSSNNWDRKYFGYNSQGAATCFYIKAVYTTPPAPPEPAKYAYVTIKSADNSLGYVTPELDNQRYEVGTSTYSMYATAYGDNSFSYWYVVDADGTTRKFYDKKIYAQFTDEGNVSFTAYFRKNGDPDPPTPPTPPTPTYKYLYVSADHRDNIPAGGSISFGDGTYIGPLTYGWSKQVNPGYSYIVNAQLSNTFSVPNKVYIYLNGSLVSSKTSNSSISINYTFSSTGNINVNSYAKYNYSGSSVSEAIHEIRITV